MTYICPGTRRLRDGPTRNAETENVSNKYKETNNNDLRI